MENSEPLFFGFRRNTDLFLAGLQTVKGVVLKGWLPQANNLYNKDIMKVLCFISQLFCFFVLVP